MGHPILKSLAADFFPVIRARGENYFRENRVRLTEVDPGDPGRVLAFVQGSSRYTVQLNFDGPQISYSCTCPFFFNEGEPCTHLWAALLKLDRSGFFNRWEAARSPETGDGSGASGRREAEQAHYKYIVHREAIGLRSHQFVLKTYPLPPRRKIRK